MENDLAGKETNNKKRISEGLYETIGPEGGSKANEAARRLLTSFLLTQQEKREPQILDTMLTMMCARPNAACDPSSLFLQP